MFMERFISILDFIDKIIINILKYLTITIFLLISLIMIARVVFRYYPVFSMHWFDEIVEMLFSALVFYGAAALWITKGHFSTGDWISKFIAGQRLKNLYRTILEVMILVFVALFFYHSYNLFDKALDVTNALMIPKKILYSCLPISGFIMLIYSIKNVIAGIISVIFPKANESVIPDEKDNQE